MIRVAEPLSWHFDPDTVVNDRRLHLVPEVEGIAPGVSGAEASSQAAVAHGVAPVTETLADYVRSLAQGSPCFWCGRPLRQAQWAGRSVLRCDGCGAEVEAPAGSRHGG